MEQPQEGAERREDQSQKGLHGTDRGLREEDPALLRHDRRHGRTHRQTGQGLRVQEARGEGGQDLGDLGRDPASGLARPGRHIQRPLAQCDIQARTGRRGSEGKMLEDNRRSSDNRGPAGVQLRSKGGIQAHSGPRRSYQGRPEARGDPEAQAGGAGAQESGRRGCKDGSAEESRRRTGKGSSGGCGGSDHQRSGHSEESGAARVGELQRLHDIRGSL